MPKALPIVLAASVVLGRFATEPRLSYELFAALFIGSLFGFWFARRGHISERIYADGLRALLLAIGLSLFELTMFIFQKTGGWK